MNPNLNPVPARLSTPDFPDALTWDVTSKTASDQRVQNSRLVNPEVACHRQTAASGSSTAEGDA